MINTVVQMPRGTKPSRRSFLFGTTQEFDCFITTREVKDKEHWALETEARNLSIIINIKGFEFSKAQTQFHNGLKFPEETK